MNDSKSYETIILTEQEAAEYLGIQAKTLQKWRLAKKGPKHIQISSKLVRYRVEDIEHWLLKDSDRKGDGWEVV
jgi:predicted DNA-binding transcriptional regulator AlpA